MIFTRKAIKVLVVVYLVLGICWGIVAVLWIYSDRRKNTHTDQKKTGAKDEPDKKVTALTMDVSILPLKEGTKKSCGFKEREEDENIGRDLQTILQNRPVEYIQNSSVFLLKVNIKDPRIHVITALADDQKDETENIYDLCQRYDCIAGVNGDFFSYPEFPPMGKCIAAGVKCDGDSEDYRSYMAFDFNGHAEIKGDGEESVINDQFAPINIMGGGPWFIENGELEWDITSSHHKGKIEINDEIFDSSWPFTGTHEFSAIGLDKGNKNLYLATTKYEMDIETMAKVLIENGVYNAMRLDGGSSTQAWCALEDCKKDNDGSRLMQKGINVKNFLIVLYYDDPTCIREKLIDRGLSDDKIRLYKVYTQDDICGKRDSL